MSRLDDPPANEDQLLSTLRLLNRFAVRCLAVLMTAVILFGVVDVVWTLFLRLREPPIFILTIGDIVGVFGAFIAVLIAIEIFEPSPVRRLWRVCGLAGQADHHVACAGGVIVRSGQIHAYVARTGGSRRYGQFNLEPARAGN